MNLAAALAHSAWLASSLPAWARFRRALNEPEQTQRHVLRRLISKNRDCAFGRSHGFGTIHSCEDFRERVPILDYEHFEPWIARIKRGESAVLTREPVTRLLPTSGSTGGRKLIPFTATFQRELNAAIGPWMLDLAREHPPIAPGPAYWSISPAIEVPREQSAVPIGFDDDCAYLGGLRQRLVETALAVPSALRLVRDVEDSRYLTLLCLLRQPELRLISIWHPSFLALLLEALPGFWPELVSDVESGQCPRAARWPEAVRKVVCIRPQPRRARDLCALGPENPRALWPHLRVVSCWADAQSAWPARDLAARLPGVAIQPKGLLATEGFVSIPFQGFHPLAVGSHFLEFADEEGRVRLAHELSVGATYRVIITTGGGLWRYPLGDVVEVDGFVGRTPSVKFLGRGQSVSDLCGEKLTEIFVTRAVAAALRRCDAMAAFALLAPEKSDGRWRYTLFVEGGLPDDVAQRLEAELCANPHYALCRELGQLGPVALCRLTSAAAGRFLQLEAAQGRRLGDVKPASLSGGTDWRERWQGFLLSP